MNLQERVDAIPYWYHRIELPDGVVTPGWAPLDAEIYKLPADLTGKRILDVGTWDGYWTFEALKRGASEVVAIDDFSDIVNFRDPAKHPPWETFDLCREALGYSDWQCDRIECSVYDVTEERFGRFDWILFLGVLYHCRHPLLALDRLSAICDEAILIESHIIDDYSPYRMQYLVRKIAYRLFGNVRLDSSEQQEAVKKELDVYLGTIAISDLSFGHNPDDMIMEFYPTNELSDNDTNWWGPTRRCLAAMVRSAGFTDIEGWKIASPEHVCHCRGFIKGWKRDEKDEKDEKEEKECQTQ